MQIDWRTQVHSPKGGEWGGGGGVGYSTKFYTGRVRHVVQSFTSFYIPFLTEKVPATGKWYAFHIPNNRCIPLTVVNALSFKYEILAKLCLKPENGTPEFAPRYTVFKSVYLPSQYGSPNERNLSSLIIIVQEEKNWLRKVSFPLHNSSSSLDNKHAYWILTS